MTHRYPAILLLLLLAAAGYSPVKGAEAARHFPAPKAESPDDIAAATIPPLPDSLADEAAVLVAWKGRYRMGFYSKGKLIKAYIIGLGQAPVGHKQHQGDNRTPEGDYRIIQKSRGPFSGPYSQYLGVAWLRINYPNEDDAKSGFKKGLISRRQKEAIITANKTGKEPPKNTRLGGGIGIHGWRGEWPAADRQNLTWGCLSLQNPQLDELYRRVEVGTRMVIYP